MLSGLIAGFHVPPVAVGPVISVRRPMPLSIAVCERGMFQTVLDNFILSAPRCLRSDVQLLVSWINTRVTVAILTLSSVCPAS